MNSAATPAPGTLYFRCNVCGQRSLTELDRLGREVVSCQTCGSTPRARAIIRVLSSELFERNFALPDFPRRPDIRGIGTTDWEGYALRLAEKFSYQNTFYHQEPRLDLAAVDLAPELIAANDFVISSEVFEHVPPPVGRAFQNVWRMLKPGGVFILTVPFGLQDKTAEHFPELHEFTIIEKNGSFVLRNVTRLGVVQEFHELVFHGGPGTTLEMRLFSERALYQHLQDAGFTDIKAHRAPDFACGVWWPEPCSFPLSARKPNL